MPIGKLPSSKKKTPTISEGIAVAIQTEIEGYEFYKLIASKSKDPGARDMFTSLADDEAEHQRALTELYGSVSNEPKNKPPVMKAKSKFVYKSPIFTKEFLSSGKTKNLEMSALSIGILLEQNSIEHYRRQSEIAADPAIKKFFDGLVRWEGEHLRALIAQKQFLQREIFANARFEPF